VASRSPVKRKGKRYQIELDEGLRRALRGLCEELRQLLLSENPAADPDLARLYPPAYPDDPLRNLDFERMAGDDLLRQRLAAIDVVAETAEAKTLTQDQLLAWLGAINNTRLVLGTRLDITEESTEEDFAGDPAREGTFGLYMFLTWLVGNIVEVVSIT
jgi:hypothetical protein